MLKKNNFDDLEINNDIYVILRLFTMQRLPLTTGFAPYWYNIFLHQYHYKKKKSWPKFIPKGC